MANRFNISALTGLGANTFKLGQAKVGRNHLGVPYFMDVIIDGLRLPNEPLIAFSSQKRIVQTSIVGSERRGTVKELISSSDYRIRIEGTCISANKKTYPQKQVEQIIALCEKPEALAIENELAELFKIYKIVITSYLIPKMQGKPYSQDYVINAVSDEDFYATLKHNL